ncbi:MAG: UvrD-helicase domain-containing protein [Clostridia bacterium]|nr:UvrD-helicase domain-containing protein [Clostridia bacterium]
MRSAGKPEFSPEQKSAIATKARETLVSAGAGSGKTSVLTQRVLNLISGIQPDEDGQADAPVCPERGTDIRDMLIVTYTRAGASEMRSRIVQKLEEAAAEQEPGSAAQKWLASQAEAAIGAEIGTIHSFCTRLLRDHYELTGIQPDFELADETALEPLRTDCITEVLESFCAANPAEGTELLVKFGPSVYQASQQIGAVMKQMESQPDPESWLQRHWRTGEEDEKDTRMPEEVDAELLGTLALQAGQLFAQRKLALGLLTFSDLEHRGLETVRILRESGNGLGGRYRYLFVDEYQDINPVQEAILQEIGGGSTVFMVGDMKQSIFGFRYAAPENFSQKDLDFSSEHSPDDQVSVHLNRNYRSSKKVVDFTNAVMRRLMTEDLGGVAYDERHELIHSRPAQTASSEVSEHVEMLVAEGGQDEEAEMVAAKIQELASQGRRYEDMVILTRSLNHGSGRMIKTLRNILAERGIRTMMRPQGEMAVETDVFLNLLRILDNPMQDVPLLSVMRLPYFSFVETDFSRIARWAQRRREADGKQHRASFCEAVRMFERAGEHEELEGADQDLYGRLQAFEATLQGYRDLLLIMSPWQAASEIADRIDFRAYLLMQPNGPSRERAFLDLLDQLKTRQQLTGPVLRRVLDGFEISVKKENIEMPPVPGVIRIMTIHASKGLEFPVVFVVNTGRSSKACKEDSVQCSDQYGITVQRQNLESGIQESTQASQEVCRYRNQKKKSELLRLLYVAMTRAREKLYLCGAAKSVESLLKCREDLRNAESMLEWLVCAWDDACGCPAPDRETESETNALVEAFDGALWTAESAGDASDTKEDEAGSRTCLEAPPVHLEKRTKVAASETVTSRTKAAAAAKTRKRRQSQQKPERQAGLQGAERGTLLHRVLAFALTEDLTAAEAIEQMQGRHLLTDTELKTLEYDTATIEDFLSSHLGCRARAADTRLEERNFFLLTDPASGPDPYGRKTRLKGTIDLAFLEDGSWVLVDYKSDTGLTDDDLVSLYGGQLRAYRDALETLSPYPVKEMYLFSLEKGEAISVPLS